MRLDKFLKTSRIIKRRIVAKSIADQGRILVNGNVAKSSTDIKSNDKLVIKFGNKTLTLQVNQLFETTKKAEADRMYTVLDEQYERDFSNE
ncbi:RNA-binding S4 domain-containing protein [Apilactobacillus micheneri]|uniref:RQC P-site tRNA stabilizing factor n=1 Tax=Apilactobacillus micheneri TaxID=1899430 RepID=A0A9Q8MTD8_9LACO|nr:RNA-binding S4 domain-containing protein [Apilactobacillus micheneri]TPR38771.1 RNA-binding S4 domain-containing protein [Apilactobacillus micheneri]TPR41305.1 RNA-binding S4 domain-containing protein [Apilactobacillus micheneri]TPR42999.1 RNA-binding S4 domain-containing protein [Apilactobacillus micheneri]TPR43285.1 RNA-binding S4 domain-containing protein [Apilactobacillus micheneri]TPR43947.1 RNA-binding S4 domain-containing protein [Apilactobacillus micheneri]